MCSVCGPRCDVRQPWFDPPSHGAGGAGYCVRRWGGSTTERTFGPHGELLTEAIQWGDGSFYRYAFTYDARGRELTADVTQTGASAIVAHVATSYGDASVGHRRTKVEVAEGAAPGAPVNRIATFEYATTGQLARVVTTMPSVPDGGADRRYGYNLAGDLIVDVASFPGAGWTSMSSWTYDRYGRVVFEASASSDGSARPSFEIDTHWGAGGVRRSCTRMATDSPISCRTYDPDGNLVAHSTTAAPDRPAVSMTFAVVADSHGRELERRVTSDPEDTSVETRTYDVHGNLLSVTHAPAAGLPVPEPGEQYDYACLEQVLRSMPHRDFTPRVDAR